LISSTYHCKGLIIFDLDLILSLNNDQFKFSQMIKQHIVLFDRLLADEKHLIKNRNKCFITKKNNCHRKMYKKLNFSQFSNT